MDALIGSILMASVGWPQVSIPETSQEAIMGVILLLVYSIVKALEYKKKRKAGPIGPSPDQWHSHFAHIKTMADIQDANGEAIAEVATELQELHEWMKPVLNPQTMQHQSVFAFHLGPVISSMDKLSRRLDDLEEAVKFNLSEVKAMEAKKPGSPQ